MILRRTALAAEILLAFACAGAAAPPRSATAPPAKTIDFQTIVQRSIPGQPGTEIRQVARDADAWRALWTTLRQGASDLLPEAPPAIDFPNEMAIVVAMPTQPCLSKVTIQSIVPRRGGATVYLLEAPPAPQCRCVVADRPLHVVRLPRIEGEIRFVAHRGQTPCGPNRY